MSLAYLVCQNKEDCSQPIPLPQPKHPGIPQHLHTWPRDGRPRNFLCPQCKHVYVYTALSVHLYSLDELALMESLQARSVVCAEVPCGTQNCESRLTVHIFSGFGEKPYGLIRAILAKATFHDVPCGARHALNGKLSPEAIEKIKPENVYFSEDWDVD